MKFSSIMRERALNVIQSFDMSYWVDLCQHTLEYWQNLVLDEVRISISKMPNFYVKDKELRDLCVICRHRVHNKHIAPFADGIAKVRTFMDIYRYKGTVHDALNDKVFMQMFTEDKH